MDGVILDSMKYHESAWREVLHASGVPVSPVDIYRREGMSGLSSVKDIFREKKVPPPEDPVIEELIEKKHALFQQNRITLFDGVIPLLEMLKKKNLRLGLVTGSHRHTVVECLEIPVRESFAVIVTADDVVKGKPSPEPYLQALKKADLRPDKALVIENAPMGIRSAKAAGIFCVAIETTLPEEYLTEADMIVGSHQELLRVLSPL